MDYDRIGAQIILYLTCTMISSVDFHIAEYLVLKIGYLWIVVQAFLMNSEAPNVVAILEKADSI